MTLLLQQGPAKRERDPYSAVVQLFISLLRKSLKWKRKQNKQTKQASVGIANIPGWEHCIIQIYFFPLSNRIHKDLKDSVTFTCLGSLSSA